MTIGQIIWNTAFAVNGVWLSSIVYALFKAMGFKKWLSILVSAILGIGYVVFGMVLWIITIKGGV